MKHGLLLFAVAAVLALGAPAQAQYVYLDANGDGICDATDVLSTTSTSLDIYMDTNHNGDGSLATCNTGVQPLDMGSYSVNLSYLGGSMTFDGWTDNLGFTIDAGTTTGGNEAYCGFGSGSALAEGLHKLGTWAITVTTGNPVVSILDFGGLSVNPTSFGGPCPGNGFDNTYTLGLDFFDACGTSTGTPTIESTWGKIKNLYR